MRARDLLSNVTRGRADAASTRALGQIGGANFIATAGAVLVTLPFVDADLRPTIAVTAAASFFSGVVAIALPWSHWRREVLALQSVWALILFTVAAHAVPEALPHYLPLFTAILLFVGVTQRPRVVLSMAPAMVASFMVATRGAAESSLYLDFAITLLLGLAGALVMSTVIERYRSTTENIDLVLQTSRQLGRTSRVEDAVAVLESSALLTMKADSVTTFLADDDDTDRYTAVRAPGPELKVDVSTEIPETVTRLAAGEQVFLTEVLDDRWALPRLVAATGARSLLHVPLAGDDDRMGALIVGWKNPMRQLDALSAKTLGIVANEAARVIARQREVRRAQREARTDPLTGLANRREFEARLESIAPRDAVVLIDLDLFKQVNDVHGHAEGDRCLRALATCMSETSRAGDCSARLGGDELVMLLRGAGLEGARTVIRNLHESWARTTPPTSISIGAAVHQPGSGPAATLARADRALYRAKAAGRDRCEIEDDLGAVLRPWTAPVPVPPSSRP